MFRYCIFALALLVARLCAEPVIEQRGKYTVYKTDISGKTHQSLKHILARNTPSSSDEGGIPRKFYETAKCGNPKDPKSMGSKIIAAWDEARTLATAQTSWKPDFDFDKIHKQWLGKDWNSWGWFYNYKKMIMDNFSNLRKVFSKDPPGGEYIYWYCYDYAQQCNFGTVAYSWSSVYFFWRNHYTAFCPVFESLQTLEDAMRSAKQNPGYQGTMETYQNNRGHVMFHEVWHYTIVSNPRTDDYAYGAEKCWNLSRDSSTYYAGFNADSYALDATAIYVQQYYSLDTPPVPRRYLAKASGDPGASPNGDGGGAVGGKVFAGPPPGWSGAPIVELNPDPSFWSEYVEDGTTGLGPDLNVAAEVFKTQPVPAAPLSTLLVPSGQLAAPALPLHPEPVPPKSSTPVPYCSTTGIPFPQPPVEAYIDDLCGQSDLYDRVLVPPISLGTGETSDRRNKVLGVSSSYPIEGATDVLHLGVMFDNNGGCLGFSSFGVGKTNSEKAENCKKHFRTVLNGCQTNTISAKLGGLLKDVCMDYVIVATHKDDPDPFAEAQWWYNMGDLRCEETDTTAIGGSSSPLAGTCRCWYLGYDDTTAVFKMPSTHNCKDVNLAELVNN